MPKKMKRTRQEKERIRAPSRKPPQPIGPGRAGTLKRAAYSAGVGKKGLRTLRSLPKSTRRHIRRQASRPGYDLQGTIGNIRSQRKSQGRNPTSGRRRKPARVGSSARTKRR